MQCEETTVWRACDVIDATGLAGLLADGREKRSGETPRFPPSSAPKSSRWLAWSRWPEGCTSPTGPVSIGRPAVADPIVPNQPPNGREDSR